MCRTVSQWLGNDLHGFTAVAELKQFNDTIASGQAKTYLHGFTAVAELKRCNPASLPAPADRDLHGFTAVAELKRSMSPIFSSWSHTISTASPPWPN